MAEFSAAEYYGPRLVRGGSYGSLPVYPRPLALGSSGTIRRETHLGEAHWRSFRFVLSKELR